MSEAVSPRVCTSHYQKPIQFGGELKITTRFCILNFLCPCLYYSNNAYDFVMSVLKGKKGANLPFLIGWSRCCLLGFYQALLPNDYFVEWLPHNNTTDALSQDKSNLNVSMHDCYAKCTQLIVSLFHTKGVNVNSKYLSTKIALSNV